MLIADGGRIYENRTVLVLRTRWGKIVEQEDFYIDPDRFLPVDRTLAERWIEPASKRPSPPASHALDPA